ncbi:MAG: hypothetical protein ACR2KO_06615 [Geodermatophilaceae bacterium]|nr:hypothetical protein [Geodermatophilaceae bacterium]
MNRWPRLATAALLGLVLGGVGVALSLLYDAGVPIAVCLVGGMVICGGASVLSGLPTEDSGDLAPDSEPATVQRSSFGDLHTVQTRFAGAADPERFEDRVRRPLADLAAERLRQRRSIDWRAQPDRAQESLDPVLWQLLTAPRGRFPASRDQAESWIQAIERL